MAATITWNGSNGAGGDGVVDTADTAGNWTAVKITAGGPGPNAIAADAAYEGTNNVTCRSDNKRVYMFTDIGSGNTLDFTGGGNAEGEMVYIWVNFLASPLLGTQSAGALGVFLESSTPSATQYHLWYFYGADNYTGGWKRLVLDPNETVSASNGTPIDLTAIRYFGAFAHGTSTAKYDNFVVDQCAVGKGLIVTGTSTTDALVADLVADELTNRHGVVIPLNDSETSVELNGGLVLGDVTASTNSTLTDVDSKIFVAEPTYHDGTEITTSVPTSFFDISVVGGTGTNSTTFGTAVGSEAGRGGLTLVGNDSYNVNIDFDNGSVNTSNWYGCSFENITGTISWGTNTAHKLFSSTFNGCSQVDPVGGIEIKNCLFVNTSATDGSILWNNSIQTTITDSKFIANTTGAGIEHNDWNGTVNGAADNTGSETTTLEDTGAFASGVSVNDIVYNETDESFGVVSSIDTDDQITHTALTGGTNDFWTTADAYSITDPYDYTNLTFSGNTNDIDNTTSGPDVVGVSKVGTSDPSTYPSGDFVAIQGSVTVQVTVKDEDAAAIATAQTAVYLTDGTQIINGDTNGSGVASGSYAGTTPVACYVRVRKASIGDTKYIAFQATATIQTSSGLDLAVTLREDVNA